MEPSEKPSTTAVGVLVLVVAPVVALGIGALGLWWAVTEQRRGDTAPGITYALIVLGVFTACLVAVGLLLLPVVGLVKIVTGHEPGDWLNAVAVVLCLPAVVVVSIGVIRWVRDQTSPLVEAFGVVCTDGEGVPEAHRLTGPGQPRIAVIDADGTVSEWTRSDAPWRADTVEETALVACIDHRDDVVIQTCDYRDGPDIDRLRSVVAVRVVAARTGQEVDRFRVTQDPRECRTQERQSIETLREPVTFAALSERLASYAEPEP